MSDQNAPTGKNVKIEKIYVKDVSFEIPNAPQIFKEKWEPKIQMNFNTEPKKIENDLVEVILTITITVKIGEKTAYLCEVQQAAVFTVQGLNNEEMLPLLGIYCPNVIFPYARETVSDLVTRGGFPQMLLAPVNFEAVYTHHMQQQQAQQKKPN